MEQLSLNMEDSRDVLQVMILREQNNYRCPNYFSLDNTGIAAPSPTTSPSLMSVVKEMAGFVTDFRNEPRIETTRNGRCVSPNSVCNPYDSRQYCSQSSLDQPSTEETSGEIRHVQSHPGRSFDDTLSLCSWRHQMLCWAYSVCERFEIDDSVLEISFNILDRFIALKILSERGCAHFLLNRQDFQLFGMVSFYIATKLFHGNKRLQLHNLVEMARGYYTINEIEKTESDILRALKWHLHPPTVMDYCEIYLTLFPLQYYKGYKEDRAGYRCSRSSFNGVTEIQALRCKCKAMVDIILGDVFFVDRANSVVALAVVLLATDEFRGCGRNATTLQTFLRNIQGVVNIHKPEFDSIISRLECSC